jgi:hypothetical protein
MQFGQDLIGGLAFQPAQFSSEMSVHNGVGPVLNTTIYMDSILSLGYGDHVREQ